jgi:anti-sigma factor RsiW
MANRKTTTKALTKTSCQEISDLVLGYLRDELTTPTRREFERHLKICPDCVSFLNTYKKTIEITGTVEPAEMPAKVRSNIRQFLRKRLRHLGALLLLCFNQLLT